MKDELKTTIIVRIIIFLGLLFLVESVTYDLIKLYNFKSTCKSVTERLDNKFKVTTRKKGGLIKISETIEVRYSYEVNNQKF